MNTKYIACCTCDNISKLTWEYMKSMLPNEVVKKHVVVKHVYLNNDESVIEKARRLQECCDLTLPEHLQFAQKLFGSAVGVGCHFMVHCCLRKRGRNASIINSVPIKTTDSLNVVPFEHHQPSVRELTSHGILLKYIPSKEELTIVIRYRLINDENSVRNVFVSRGITGAAVSYEGEDLYPLFSDTEVFGSTIKQINLNTRTVVLCNNMIYSIQNVMDEMDRLLN